MTKRIKITAEIEQHVIDLYEQYKSSDRVAAEIGIGSTTVLRILERSGIKRTGKKLIARDDNICQICGKPCDSNDHTYGLFGPMYPSIDHIIPLVKGGTHTWDNVQLAHIVCNSRKRDRVGGAAIEQANTQRAS